MVPVWTAISDTISVGGLNTAAETAITLVTNVWTAHGTQGFELHSDGQFESQTGVARKSNIQQGRLSGSPPWTRFELLRRGSPLLEPDQAIDEIRESGSNRPRTHAGCAKRAHAAIGG